MYVPVGENMRNKSTQEGQMEMRATFVIHRKAKKKSLEVFRDSLFIYLFSACCFFLCEV